MSVCSNVVVTFMILARCYQKARRSSAWNPLDKVTHRTIKAVIESGALFFIAQLSYAVLTMLEHPSAQLAALVAVQVYVRPYISKYLT